MSSEIRSTDPLSLQLKTSNNQITFDWLLRPEYEILKLTEMKENFKNLRFNNSTDL
jgi:hypothetical protein